MSLRSVVSGMRLRAASWVAGKQLQATWNGASTSRLFWDWAAGILSADSEIRGNLTLLRARARDLAKNNSYIRGYVLEFRSNVVGPDGILLQAKIANSAGDLNKRTNFAIEAGWMEWGYPENVSIDGQTSWVDIQGLIADALAIDGEVFIRFRRDARNPFGFALQLLDPDLLDDQFNQPPVNGVEITMGVEKDQDGRPVAYHFWPRHPSELWRSNQKRERVRVSADEIIHLFPRYRIGQTRGVTPLAPILTDIKMLDGYEEAELVAARLQAAQFGALVVKNPDLAASLQGMASASSKKTDPVMDAAPGSLITPPPGYELQMFDPKHPSMAFKEFTKTILRAISRGLGISYHTLTGDLESVNYSSIRAGLLPERDQWRAVQKWLAMHCHRRVYREWIAMALLSGQVRVDSRIASNYYAVEWKPRGWQWVDPANELQAAEAEIHLGINSRQRLASERGRDFEDIVDELQYEQEYAEAAGIWIGGAGGEERISTATEMEEVPPDDGTKDDSEEAKTKALRVVNGGR